MATKIAPGPERIVQRSGGAVDSKIVDWGMWFGITMLLCGFGFGLIFSKAVINSDNKVTAPRVIHSSVPAACQNAIDSYRVAGLLSSRALQMVLNGNINGATLVIDEATKNVKEANNFSESCK